MKRLITIAIIGVCLAVFAVANFIGERTYSRAMDSIMDEYGFPPADSSAMQRAQRRGLFGDQFGGLNALLNGLALVGVIIATCLQTIELRHQRAEARAAILRHANERAERERVRRVSHALVLYQEWNGGEMFQARKELGEELLLHGGILNGSISTYETSGEAIAVSVLRVYAYFEQWAVLVARNEVDGELMKRLLGGSYAHWKRLVLTPCWERETNEAALEMKAHIEKLLG